MQPSEFQKRLPKVSGESRQVEKTENFLLFFLLLVFYCSWLGFDLDRGRGDEVDLSDFVFKEGVFQKWKLFELEEGCLRDCNIDGCSAEMKTPSQ